VGRDAVEEAMPLKLYGHDPSPFVRRIRILLEELGLPFERDAHGWLDPVPGFLDNSPIKRVPMLDRGPGAKVRFVYESRVIAAVLYETPGRAPAPDLQPTLFLRALEEHDQNLLSALDVALDSAVNIFLLEKDGVTKEQSSYLQRQAARVNECLDWVDRQYSGKLSFTPGHLAYVDLCTVSTIGWLRFRNRADVTRWPNLVAVEAATKERPSFVATRPG
jgi:glutathione S-transferase